MPSGESEFLRSVPLFAALPDSALAELSERARPLALSAGAWLFREGDAAADIMAARGEGPIVASDVTARFAPPRAQAAQASSMRRVAARVRSAVVGTSDAAPRLQETLVRSITIGSLDTTEVARRYADLVIAPEVETVGMMAFDQLERIREAGRRATAAALEAAPELVASWR